MPKRSFDITVFRRREIERHARHVGAAETEDFWRWPVAWCWHNLQSKDPINALIDAVARMGGKYSIAEAEDVLRQAEQMPRRCRARPLGNFLGVTYEHRRICGIRTFGPCMSPALRREQKRMTEEARRRVRGSKSRQEYEANSLSRKRPWEKEGISRRTWERRRRQRQNPVASPCPIIPTPKLTQDRGQSSFLSSDMDLRQGKESGAVRGCPRPNAAHLTQRWLAAREKACALGHNARRVSAQAGGVGSSPAPVLPSLISRPWCWTSLPPN
jgi:hypothetical protein